MTLIIIGLIAYAVYRASFSVQNRKKEEQRKAEADRMKLEQVRMREEWKARVAEAKIETDRMIKIEREQMRLAKEQQRQAEELAKHEERIADLEFRMTQAEADIDHWTEQVGNLYALLDLEQTEQAGALAGSKTDIKCQKRIITLNNQIHMAEQRLAKAKHIKETAEKKLSA